MGQPIAMLKDGFWEETAVYQSDDGVEVVRKCNRPSAFRAPWARETLRKEIRYLQALKPPADRWFPPLVRSWETEDSIGYEIPYYKDRANVAQHIDQGNFDQSDAERLQQALTQAILTDIHEPRWEGVVLPGHVKQVLTNAVDQLGQEERFAHLVAEKGCRINEQAYPSLKHTLVQFEESGLLDELDKGPRVRLHGDLILENILCGPSFPQELDILFIDPVSVAGVEAGHPLFDLVKYESYATGELLALRSEWLEVTETTGGYHYHLDWERSELALYRQLDLCQTFRRNFEKRYGTISQPLYLLLDGYFSLAMAVNTTGNQQMARVLKGIVVLNAALVSWIAPRSNA